MLISEREKLGISTLWQRFSDTSMENIPIKKRKFSLVRSPSHVLRTRPCPEECHLKAQSTSNVEKSATSLFAEWQASKVITAVSPLLDQGEIFKVDIGRKDNLTETRENHGDGANFSGISILAAAACSDNIDCSSSNLEDPASYNSLVTGGDSSRIVNAEASSIPDELGTGQDLQEDFNPSKCPAVSIISEKSMAIMQAPPAKKNVTQQRVEASSSRNDRLHWDLNIVMDAWECPFDELIMDAKQHADFMVDKGRIKRAKVMNFGHCRVQMEPRDTKDHNEMSVQDHDGQTFVIDEHDSYAVASSTMQEILPCFSESLVADVAANKHLVTCLLLPEIHESNEDEHHLDACTGLDSLSLVKIPCEINHASNVMTDFLEESKPLHNQELITECAAAFHCELVADSCDTCTVAEEKAVIHCMSFDGERNGEIISSQLVVIGDTSGGHTAHLHEPHGAGHITKKSVTEGTRGDAAVVDSEKQSREQFASDAQDGKASWSRSPSPRGDCNHMESKTVSENGIYSSSVVSPRSQSGDQCMGGMCRSEGTCLRSPLAEYYVAFLATDSDKDSCRIGDSTTLGHCTERTSLLVDDSISQVNVVDGSAMDQSGTGERSSRHLKSSIHESLNCVELPTAATFSQDETIQAVADIKQRDGKTSVVFYEDVSGIEMSTRMHIDPQGSVQNTIDGIQGTVSTPAVMGASLSLKVLKSNEENDAYCSGRVDVDDSFTSDYELDNVSQNDNATLTENVTLFQAGDDSQYEDGEFRESFLHIWEEEESEEIEVERVDYGSDDTDTDAFEPSADDTLVDNVEFKKEILSEASHVFEERSDEEKNKKEPNCQPSLQGSLETNPSPAKSGNGGAMKVVGKISRRELGTKDESKKLEMGVKFVSEANASGDEVLRDEKFRSRQSHFSAILRTKSTGWDQLPDVGRSSRDAIMDVSGSDILKNRVSRLDSLDADGSLRRVFRSTSSRELSRRELISHIEGSNCSDVPRKDKVYTDGSRSNNLNDIHLRIGKDVDLAKSIGRCGSSVHLRGADRVGNRCLESSGGHWGQNRHHSPGYHGPGDGLHGPPNAAAAVAAQLERCGFFVAPDGMIVGAGGVTPGRDCKQSAPSRNMHCSPTGRGSSNERDGALHFPVPLGHGYAREMSPSRSVSGARGRSFKHAPRVRGTGQEERYNGLPCNGNIASSLPIQVHLARQQRSFSPIPRRHMHHSASHAKCPSRSRSCSPHMWVSPRGSSSEINRGPHLKVLGRSPNFHSGARIERMGSPHQRCLDFPENVAGFAPARRNHSSPCASRWFDDRRGDAPDHFKRRPGKGFSQNHRFGSMDSPRRIKTDEYFRPMHSSRSSEFGVVGGRARREGNNDARQKHDETYTIVRSMRHCDDDIGKCFRNVHDGLREHQPRSKNVSESNGRGSPRNYSRFIGSRSASGPKRDGEERGRFRYVGEGRDNPRHWE